MDTERQELSVIVERAEARGWEDLVACAPPAFATEHSMRSWHVDAAVGFMFDVPPNPFFNRFHGFGVLCPATGSMLDAAVAPWQGTGRTYIVHVSPNPAAPDIDRILDTRGLVPSMNWVKMIRGNEPPPAIATDLRIEEIGPDQAAAFAGIAAESFGLPEVGPWIGAAVGRPGWHAYLAFDGSLPVACGLLHVEDGVGWLGTGGTLPSHRGRGAQGALLARRIEDAIAVGCRHIATETGEETAGAPNPSYRNMLRTGFRLVYARRNWIGTASGD